MFCWLVAGDACVADSAYGLVNNAGATDHPPGCIVCVDPGSRSCPLQVGVIRGLKVDQDIHGTGRSEVALWTICKARKTTDLTVRLHMQKLEKKK